MSEAMIPRRALLSVSDKTGLVELARSLQRLGVQLLSTGGTARALRDAGLDVIDVSAFTGAPEIMDGRVKTLHPKVHGGLLGREALDAAVMAEHGIEPIDLLVVNLYPFAATIATPGVSDPEAIEQIDIGGPAMLRAGAKNHDRVAVLCEPADYAGFIAALDAGGTDLAFRRRLAARVYAHTARYDGMIAEWLGARAEGQPAGSLPPTMHLSLVRKATLRYGENPHQSAALYVEPGAPSDVVATAEVLGGKELSFNNLADAEAALECVRQFAKPAAVIVKHANPCGVAEGTGLLDAYDRAYATDPVSAFGGIIAFNRPLDAATAAEIIQRQFVEVVLAPEVDEAARAALATKPNVRVLRTGPLLPPGLSRDLKRLRGGLLVQDMDTDALSVADLRVVTKRAPTEQELEDLLFAWKVAFFVKSNAIVYARDGRTIGVGAGQMSRVVSARIAGWKATEAGLEVAGSAMASDAFFPFPDGIDAAAAAGIRAVIQPGGSMRDKEVIAAADEHGLAMVFTGRRHFRH